MVKCSFCGEDLLLGGGKLFAKRDGTVSYFCSNKCEKNQLKLRRNPVDIRWTDSNRKMRKIKSAAKGKTTEAKKGKEDASKAAEKK